MIRMNTQEETHTPFLPIYLAVGEDELKRQTVRKRLYERLEKLGDIAFNCDQFDGNEATGLDIVSACNTLPFACDYRLVEVHNAGNLKKADSEELVSYLNQPSESTILFLDAEKLSKASRLYKAIAKISKEAIVDCAALKRYELPRTVRAQAVNHGITLSDSAANAVVELVGENTIALDNALKNIALSHHGSDNVSAQEVRNLITRTAEVKPWEFVDALSARDLKKSLWCLERMESVSPHALLPMSITRIRELIATQSLQKRGQAQKLASELKVPAWRVKNHPTWARAFKPAELRFFLKKARDTERLMKTGTDPHEAFLDWVILVCRKK